MTVKKLEETLDEVTFKEVKKNKKRIMVAGQEIEIKKNVFANMLDVVSHRLAENDGGDPYEVYVDTAESGFLTKTDSIFALLALLDKDNEKIVRELTPKLHELDEEI